MKTILSAGCRMSVYFLQGRISQRVVGHAVHAAGNRIGAIGVAVVGAVLAPVGGTPVDLDLLDVRPEHAALDVLLLQGDAGGLRTRRHEYPRRGHDHGRIHLRMAADQAAVVLVLVHQPREGQRPRIAAACDAAGLLAGHLQRWHQDRHEDCDNGNDDEQLDEGESFLAHPDLSDVLLMAVARQKPKETREMGTTRGESTHPFFVSFGSYIIGGGGIRTPVPRCFKTSILRA